MEEKVVDCPSLIKPGPLEAGFEPVFASETSVSSQSLSESSAPARSDGFWGCPQCGSEISTLHLFCLRCNIPRPGSSAKKGDWLCRVKTCHAHNFAFRNDCHKCHAYKGTERVGDWPCFTCKKNNFASRTHCFNCGQERPKHLERFVPVSFRPGDWHCTHPGCLAVNFMHRKTCFRCKNARSPHAHVEQTYSNFRPGDWICSTCSSLCYSSRVQCLRCMTPRPNEMWAIDPATGAYFMPSYFGYPMQPQYEFPPYSYMQASSYPVAMPGWVCEECHEVNSFQASACLFCKQAPRSEPSPSPK
jgi:hypothetical protein